MSSEAERAVTIRPYVPRDAEATLRIFHRAVSISALSRYTPGQVEAWLGGPRDIEAWAADRSSVSTFIADVNANPVGFSDLADDGYVDRLFVDPDHGRRGIGSALLRHVEAEARRRSIPVLSTHASLVARPVFEASGYTVAYPETVHKDGENLDRFFMTKRLASVGVERVHDEIVCVRR